MVDIVSRCSEATSGLVYEINQIATSVLCLIGEEHCIYAHDEEASISYGPSIKPLMSSTTVRIHPIQGRGKGGG